MQTHSENDGFVNWLMDGVDRARKKGVIPRIMPAEFRGHVRAANLEMLMAMRSLLDKAITRMEDQPISDQPKHTTRIKVE